MNPKNKPKNKLTEPCKSKKVNKSINFIFSAYWAIIAILTVLGFYETTKIGKMLYPLLISILFFDNYIDLRNSITLDLSEKNEKNKQIAIKLILKFANVFDIDLIKLNNKI